MVVMRSNKKHIIGIALGSLCLDYGYGQRRIFLFVDMVSF